MRTAVAFVWIIFVRFMFSVPDVQAKKKSKEIPMQICKRGERIFEDDFSSKEILWVFDQKECSAKAANPNPFADWPAHLFAADRVQYILATNTPSLYSMAIHGRGITDGPFICRLWTTTIRARETRVEEQARRKYLRRRQ
ncbi:MAG: hypothetical protein GXP25_10795 [Planctomycetes bacterium]|nr:hypothetical protein [Planctomycetota bacterium]